jgi:hypothetical protein
MRTDACVPAGQLRTGFFVGFWFTVVFHLQSIQHRAWYEDNRSRRTTSPRHEAWWWPLTHWVALKDRPLNEVGKYGNYGMQEEHNQSIKLPHTGWREPGKAPQGVHTRKHPSQTPVRQNWGWHCQLY